MNFTYLVGDGPEAKKTLELAIEKTEKQAKLLDNLEKEIGAFALYTKQLSGEVSDLAFKAQLSLEQCKKLGLNYNYSQRDGYYIYKPDRRLNTGKALSKNIEKINKTATTVPNEIKEILQVDCLKIGPARHGRGTGMYFTSVGWKDNKIFLRIPGTKKDKEFPKYLPSWLREPEGEEFNFFMR